LTKELEADGNRVREAFGEHINLSHRSSQDIFTRGMGGHRGDWSSSPVAR
jgi:hypothetical protein